MVRQSQAPDHPTVTGDRGQEIGVRGDRGQSNNSEGTAKPYTHAMIFIETSLFTKLLPDYLTDDEYRALQDYLLKKPDAGDIVRGSGGVRKVRWAPQGQGKSGGIRAIYYWKKSNDEIWMLTLYSKPDRATIASHVLKQIVEAIQDE